MTWRHPKSTRPRRSRKREPAHATQVNVAYHVTTPEAWVKIQKEGLQPRRQKLGYGLEQLKRLYPDFDAGNAYKPAIYMFNSESEVDSALMNWLGDEIGENYIVLAIDVRDLWPKLEDDPEINGSAIRSFDPIPAKKIVAAFDPEEWDRRDYSDIVPGWENWWELTHESEEYS